MRNSPRWLGWALLVGGAVLAAMMLFFAIIVAWVGSPWGLIAFMLGWVMVGALALIAGVRILSASLPR